MLFAFFVVNRMWFAAPITAPAFHCSSLRPGWSLRRAVALALAVLPLLASGNGAAAPALVVNVEPRTTSDGALEVLDAVAPATSNATETLFALPLPPPSAEGLTVFCYGASAVGDAWLPSAPADARASLAVVTLPAPQPDGVLRVAVAAAATEDAGGGRPGFRAVLPFLRVQPGRHANIAPRAAVSVSSADTPSEGFQPRPWVNRPETLTDGFVDARQNFATAPRAAPLSPEAPEWMMLVWDVPQCLAGFALFFGSHDRGLGDFVAEVYTGTGDPRFAAQASRDWRTLPLPTPAESAFRRGRIHTLARSVTTSALRLRCTGGVMPPGLGEIVVLSPVANDGADGRVAEGDPAGAELAPIRFALPEPATVTLQIRDADGRVVANPVAGVRFPAGTNTAWWNLEDVAGDLVTQPGSYRWQGLYNPGLRVDYRFSYYPTPVAGMPWHTSDRTGGWLADHELPRSIARAGDRLWLAAYGEAGDSIVEVDGAARKLWGIDRVFRDQRVGLLWRFPEPPASEVLAETSLFDEHFGGILQRVRDADGRDRYFYVVGKTHCSVVELTGLDRIRRLAGAPLEVTARQVVAATQRRQAAAARTQPPRTYLVTNVVAGAIAIDGDDRDWPGGERVEGCALAYDRTHLYILHRARDDRAPFANAGDNPLRLFASGDVVDVMLQTGVGLDPRRLKAGPGDIRLSIAMLGGAPVCVLYDYLVPGFAGERIAFSSPWRTQWCDRVTVLANARVAVMRRSGGDVAVEAAVPLADIHLAPAKLGETRGDLGRIWSDQTGSATARRTYWANRQTALLSDLPSEAGVQPNLWGLFRFAPPIEVPHKESADVTR